MALPEFMKYWERERSAPRALDITGKLLALYPDKQPVTFRVAENPAIFVPIFSDEDKLRESMVRSKISEYDIKIVQDGVDFVDSIAEQGLRIMLDPYIHNGNTRWTEVKPNEAAGD
jgi:hypothetical protein